MRKVAVFVLLMLHATLFIETAMSQEGRSVFSALDTHGRTVTLREEQHGTLSESDLLFPDGNRLQVWALSVSEGEPIRVELRSRDFDALLYIVGPGLNEGIRDDDGGSGSDSMICFIPELPGEYRAIVSSYGDRIGGFSIVSTSVEQGCADQSESGFVDDFVSELRSLPTDSRTISMGESQFGSLGNTDFVYRELIPAQAWSIHGVSGTQISIDLTSDDFDPSLIILGPDQSNDVHYDDDGAGGCDSRLTFTFGVSGDYRLVVTSSSSAVGSYQLHASNRPRPTRAEPCDFSTDGDKVELSLNDIPIVGSLVVNQEVVGTMDRTDAIVGGSQLQSWTLEGAAGQRITITLTSDQFDTYLVFDGPGFLEPLSDDDGLGGTDSVLCVELAQTETYRVFPGSYFPTESGDQYRLRAGTRDGDAVCEYFTRSITAMAMGAPTIRADEEHQGVLAGDSFHPQSGRPLQAWVLRAKPGTHIDVELASSVFDTFLYAIGEERGVLTSDDYGDSTNSFIAIAIPDTGEVTLLASSYDIASRGEYTLRTSTRTE